MFINYYFLGPFKQERKIVQNKMIIVMNLQCLMQSQGRTFTIVTTVREGPEMRSHKRLGRGKIQKLWQRMQTVTSLNNLHTRKHLCTLEKAELKKNKVLC